MHEHWRHRLLGAWATLVSRRPLAVVVVALLLVAASIAVSVQLWSFKPNRNDLISRELDWNQRFIAWQEHFPGSFDLYVVVDTFGADGKLDPGDPQRARAVVDELGPKLAASPHIRDAMWGFDPSTVGPRAIRLLPLDQFEQRVSQIEAAGELLRSGNPAQLLAQLAAGGGDTLETLRGLRPEPWQYLTSDNERLLFLRLTPRRAETSLNALESAIGDIRAIIAQVVARHPGADVGLTGIEVVEADETVAATRDSTIASVVAVVLISVLLVLAFHSFRTPLLIVASLLVGVAWSFGFLFLAVGHLQVISVVFTVMLLGLGVAFGIHIASRYELIRHDYPDGPDGFVAAMRDTIETIGPGIITGAVTTAAAFCTTLLTDFTGVAEMGLISGVGVMLCLLAMFSVFPALLRLFKPDRRHVVGMADRYVHFYEDRWIKPFVRYPKSTLAAACAVTALSLVAVTQMRFDYNLTNLLPRGIDSVEWQERIVRDGEVSIWFGISIVDSHEEAARRAAAFRDRAATPGSTIEDVGGYALLFPRHEAQKLERLAAVRERLTPVLQRILDAGPPSGDAPASLNPFAGVQRRYEVIRYEAASAIAAALDPAPLQPSDLPPEVMRPYIGTMPDGSVRYAVEVYPRQPPGVTSPLDPRFLPRLVGEMERVDPQITGVIMQVYRSGTLIWNAYVVAGLLAFAIVLVLVYVDFQTLTDAALALVPVAVGFAVTFGLLYAIGEQINPANIIVLPLMFGIGVDAGVHMLHRFRLQPDAAPPGLASGTGKGITVTSLTTIVGFGTMMLARHRGIASLGFVLSVGILLTLLACLIVMPAILKLRLDRRRAKNAGGG